MPKLSQISPAGSPPAPTDHLVGVVGGTTDVLFSVSSLPSGGGGLTPTNASPIWYVDSDGNPNGGNDSNNGTDPTTPFATAQHALNVAAGFLYTQGSGPSILLLDGTHTLSQALFIGPLPGLGGTGSNGTGFTFQSNSGNPSTCIINGQGARNPFFVSTGLLTPFNFGFFTINCSGSPLINSGSYVNLSNLILEDTSNSGGPKAIQTVDYGETYLGAGGSATFTWPNAVTSDFIFRVHNYSVLDFGQTQTFNFHTGSSALFIELILHSSLQIYNNAPSITNPVTGLKLFMRDCCSVVTPNGQISDIPGSGGIEVDATCTWQNNFTPGQGGLFGFSRSGGVPTTTDVPAQGTFGVIKDTTGGGVYLAYNDGGTIKKVQLT